MSQSTQFVLSVQPWKHLALPQLAIHVLRLGFHWIELPIQPGFPVEPTRIEQDLPAAVKLLADLGIGVVNVTAALPLDDERLYAACAAGAIHMHRVIFKRTHASYWESEAEARRQLDAAIPLCERYGMKIGIQNHTDGSIPLNSMGLYHLSKEYDPRHVGAIWDTAHHALHGEDAHTGLELVRSHLCGVHLNNAIWRRVSGPEEAEVRYAPYFCMGKQGRISWHEVAAGVKQAGYTGPLTLTAEYSDENYADRLLEADLAYARAVFAGVS